MAVKVIFHRNSSGTPTAFTDFPEAGYIFVKDGHLHVCDSVSVQTNVAIFAPSQWESAQLS